MKTTIDIPEPLYKKAKFRAIEQGVTLKQIMLTSLEHTLSQAVSTPPAVQSFAQRRRLRPKFQQLRQAGALAGGVDSAVSVSEDRSARENALL
jgi:hypothetical protein